jgi:hypothetical protein
MSTTTRTPIDLLSEEFAGLAADQMEKTTRETRTFLLNGQVFEGEILGFGSSFSEEADHKGHMPGTPPNPDERCPVCRWADVAILRTATEEGKTMYVLAAMGKSEVPGETQRVKSVWTEDPESIYRHLSVPGREGAAPKIPIPNARAFRFAAFADLQIREVLHDFGHLIPDVQKRRSGQGF